MCFLFWRLSERQIGDDDERKPFQFHFINFLLSLRRRAVR